jgi:DNA-binding LacI/PurR family transcriptional regulator
MTVKEIANIAGVSPAAVSVVLNDKKGVSDETRKKVLDIMQKYNYTKNKRAKAYTKNICFLKYKKHGMLVEQNEGFIAAILDAIEGECRSEGFNLSMVISDNNFSETLKNINFDVCDGLIVLGTELEEEEFKWLSKVKKPCIVLDNAVRNYPYNSIAINNEETVYCALSHLASLGHKSIAYFHSNVSIANFEERDQAFKKYCRKFNLDFKPENQFNVTPTLIGAYTEMKQYLASCDTLPKCAFADNDSIAIGAIKALKESGYHVPKDISIIGFDDIHFSQISTPPLTTMRIPKKLIGTLAIRQICDMIEYSHFNDVKLSIGGELVLRSSTSSAD